MEHNCPHSYVVPMEGEDSVTNQGLEPKRNTEIGGVVNDASITDSMVLTAAKKASYDDISTDRSLSVRRSQ